MRVSLQRVSSASVTVEGALVSKIGGGFLIFFGVSKNSDPSDLDCH